MNESMNKIERSRRLCDGEIIKKDNFFFKVVKEGDGNRPNAKIQNLKGKEIFDLAVQVWTNGRRLFIATEAKT